MVTSKRDREQFGRFYYRFPEGESGLDVYTRVTSFISTMFRDFGDAHICRPDLNVIIVTHGLTLRLVRGHI
jgi:broad specificity phosphatase PhoE